MVKTKRYVGTQAHCEVKRACKKVIGLTDKASV